MAVRGESVKFCSECGATVNLVIPDDDDRLRHVCSACAMVHYVNPKVIVGCLPAVGEGNCDLLQGCWTNRSTRGSHRRGQAMWV